MSWLLPRLVGLRTAQEIILAGRRLDAEAARALGLVTRTVDADAFADTGAAEAVRLAAMSAPAIGAARGLLLESLGSTLEGHLEREARAIAATSAGAEAREGVAAFLEKSAARFTGQGPPRTAATRRMASPGGHAKRWVGRRRPLNASEAAGRQE